MTCASSKHPLCAWAKGEGIIIIMGGGGWGGFVGWTAQRGPLRSRGTRQRASRQHTIADRKRGVAVIFSKKNINHSSPISSENGAAEPHTIADLRGKWLFLFWTSHFWKFEEEKIQNPFRWFAYAFVTLTSKTNETKTLTQFSPLPSKGEWHSFIRIRRFLWKQSICRNPHLPPSLWKENKHGQGHLRRTQLRLSEVGSLQNRRPKLTSRKIPETGETLDVYFIPTGFVLSEPGKRRVLVPEPWLARGSGPGTLVSAGFWSQNVTLRAQMWTLTIRKPKWIL